jgi:hypothetical protein
MITEKNHKLLTSQLFVTDCTKRGWHLCIDGRNLIFGHKLHISIPYRGKRLPSIVAEKNATKNEHICSMCIKINSWQRGSRNLMGPKTLPTIWDTYMKLVICPFFVTFFSATIDGRNLIFGHKYFLTRQIPTS